MTTEIPRARCARLHGRAARLWQNVSMLRGRMRYLLLWPLVSLLLIGATLMVISSMLVQQKSELDADSLKDAATLSRQYGEQLSRTIGQIDEIAMNLKRRWEAAPGAAKREQALGMDMYPLSGAFNVLLLDRDGAILGDARGSNRNLADRDYFVAHREHAGQALRISKPMTGKLSGKKVIVFSRRVDTRDGSFAGVVVIAVEPRYFSSYVQNADLGIKDFQIALDPDGTLLAGGRNDRSGRPSQPFATLPAFDAAAGAMPLDGTRFVDGTTRFVAWKTLDRYPLTVVAGVSQEQEFMPYVASQAYFHKIAYAITGFLILFAATGITFSARLFLRKHQADVVKDTYRMAVDAARDGFYMVRPVHDRHGRITDFEVADCNQRGADYYGLTPQKLVGMRFTAFTDSGMYVQEVIRVFIHAMDVGYYEDEFQVPSASPVRTVWLHRRLMRSHGGLAVTLRDVSEGKAHEHALARLANEDRLTGLPNRNWLVSYLPAAIAQGRSAASGFGLLMVDLDNFKDINDTLGHAVGDQLLQVVGTRLRSLVEPTDHVTRQGGDEFGIVIDGAAAGRQRCAAEIADVADRILAVLQEIIVLEDGTRHRMQASIGICLYPEDGNDAETLLKHADLAMYAAKATGKGDYRFFSRELSERLVLRLEREQALRVAIANDEFVLYYQPRVDTATGELRSMEALVRWIHPVRGVVPPVEFIEMAETTGLILQLGEMVIDKACAQIAAWRAEGLRLVPVSVNVSPRQFMGGNLGRTFADRIGQYDIPADLIEMEITESSMMGDSDDIAANLASIKSLGIRLLVDDFGTGYASLSQLQRLRLDGLKVDRSFTSTLDRSTDGEVFYQAILSMAHALGMNVVAEGVETLGQLKKLQAMSCAEIQGYYVSPPVPAPNMAVFMQTRFLFPHDIPDATCTGAA